ncbi:MAG TPA: lysophospholipid acyltransferase family protein [Sulfurovum sp.]|uniref:lysophospholipid acyltransferase family protein n=1 Tax=Sulfurovum sp. TaxID=1969726 RepID=UPI002F95AABE
MREKIEYALVKLFLWLAKIAPRAFIYAVIRSLTLLVYHLDKKRRHLTITNLTMTFPGKSSEEIKALSKAVYTELSKTISEILLMFTGRFDIDHAIKNRDEVKETLQKLAQNSPHGIVFMTAHFSNWELMAHFIAKHGLPMAVIGRKGNNRLIETNITTPFREKYGNSAVSKDKAMLSMMKRLKAQGNVGLLIDQKSGGSHSAKLDFFGKPAETTLSVASLKLKLDPLIVPVFVVRNSDGLYELVIHEPVEYKAEEIEDQQKKLEAMTLRYNQAIEDVVRKYPAQWFWMHNRWRV